MKTTIALLLLTLFLSVQACKVKPGIEDIQKFSATEVYPNDTFLSKTQNKRALVIVAHDDDDCAMSGTIAKLSAEGWEVMQLSLQSHVDKSTGRNPAHLICKGNEPILSDGYYRKGLDTMKAPYLPIPYEEIQKQFLRDKVAQSIITKVNVFKPSVIFTLDNIKGGYGHPEHIFISQLVLELFQEKKLSVEKVYQSVYTNHMESEIVDKWLKEQMDKWGYPHSSTIANELYKIDGMPEPTVQVNILNVAETKMSYLKAYDESVRKNLRKFIPYYEEFPAETYFKVFDREFFRVME